MRLLQNTTAHAAMQSQQSHLPLAVEIQPLTLQHISAYLKQAGKSLASVRTILRMNVTLQHLITTPLLLITVLLTYRDKMVKDLPQLGSAENQQQQIFAHYIQRMLERHLMECVTKRPRARA